MDHASPEFGALEVLGVRAGVSAVVQASSLAKCHLDVGLPVTHCLIDGVEAVGHLDWVKMPAAMGQLRQNIFARPHWKC